MGVLRWNELRPCQAVKRLDKSIEKWILGLDTRVRESGIKLSEYLSCLLQAPSIRIDAHDVDMKCLTSTLLFNLATLVACCSCLGLNC